MHASAIARAIARAIMHARVCACNFVPVCVSVCMCVHVYVCLCVRLCMCVYASKLTTYKSTISGARCLSGSNRLSIACMEICLSFDCVHMPIPVREHEYNHITPILSPFAQSTHTPSFSLTHSLTQPQTCRELDEFYE